MTKVNTMDIKVLNAMAIDFLEKRGYRNLSFTEGLGSTWKNKKNTIEIMINHGHNNSLIRMDPYLRVQINNGDFNLVYTPQELRAAFSNL